MTPALVLAPPLTADEPKAPSRTPEPSAIHNAGPKKTATDPDPASYPTPASDPQGLPQPGHTTNSFDPDSTNSNPPTPGLGTTISGIPMSVGSGGVVVGSDTVRLPAVVGSAFTQGAPFTGSASESARISRWVLLGLIGVVVAL